MCQHVSIACVLHLSRLALLHAAHHCYNSQSHYAGCTTSKSITERQQGQLTASSCGDIDTLTDRSTTVVHKQTCLSCTHLDSLWAGRMGWLPVALPDWSPFLTAAAAVTLHTTHSFNTSGGCQLHMTGTLACFCCHTTAAKGAWSKGLGARLTSLAHVRMCRVVYGMQASSLLLMLCNRTDMAVEARMDEPQLMHVLLPILSHTLQNTCCSCRCCDMAMKMHLHVSIMLSDGALHTDVLHTKGKRGCEPWVEGGGGVGHGLLQGRVCLAGQACSLALILLVGSCFRRHSVPSRLTSPNNTCTASLLVPI